MWCLPLIFFGDLRTHAKGTTDCFKLHCPLGMTVKKLSFKQLCKVSAIEKDCNLHFNSTPNILALDCLSIKGFF